jgi:hypothetical protein
VHQPFDRHQPAGLELPQGNFAQVLAMPEAHGANTLSATRTGARAVHQWLTLHRPCSKGDAAAAGNYAKR